MERKGIEELKKKYVKALLDFFYGHNKGKNWGVKAIEVLFRLSEASHRDEFIAASELERAGIRFGIGRWMSSGVVEKAERRRAYRIKDIFYESTKQALIEYDRECSQQMQ